MSEVPLKGAFRRCDERHPGRGAVDNNHMLF